MLATKIKNHRRDALSLSQVPILIILLVYFAIIVYPLFWILMSSLKTTEDISVNIWALPKVPQWHNYADAWRFGISGYFINSIIVTVSTIFAVLVIASLGAYGLSRFKVSWLKYVLIFVMGGMMLNPQVCLIPLYKLLTALKLRNTYWALIIPYTTFRLPLNILLIRTFFLSIPKEIEESAKLDGCTNLQTYARIFVPMSTPIMITGAILTAYYAWNEFMFAIIFIDSNKYRTIPAGLMAFRDALQINWGPLIAGMVIASLPLVLFFLFAQKQFIRGMTAGSVKG